MSSADEESANMENLVQSLNLPVADKKWVLDQLTDAEHLGEIEDVKQYAAFKRTAQALEEQAIAAGIPVRTLAAADAEARARWVAWTRTFAGTMLTAIDAAILGWEEEHA